MKNKRKKIADFLKLGALLLGFPLLLWNCEKDVIIEKQAEDFIVKQYSLEDLKSNIKFYNTFKLLETRKKELSKKSTNENLYDFKILPTSIKEVTLGDITSYTIEVKRPSLSQEYFENLVIQLEKDKLPKAYIIKYVLDSKVELFEEHNSFKFKGKSKVFPLNLNSDNTFLGREVGECPPISQAWCSWQEDHVAGPSCHEANDGRIYRKLVDDDNCTESGGPSSGGGGVGGSSTGNPGAVIVTSPQKTTDGNATEVDEGALLANKINIALNYSLTPEEMGWLINNPSESSSIDIFLETNNTPEAKTFAEQAIEALMDLDAFEATINNPNFDPLNDSWLGTLRDLAQRLEYLRTHIPETLWTLMNIKLNAHLQVALTLTAKEYNPNVANLTETQKQNDFDLDGKKGVGILLYEFANGKGPEIREFSNGMFWLDYFEGDRINQIKSDFEFQLNYKGITFNQFVANGNMILGGNAFSPDHTNVVHSIQQHVNANWVQFFVGGTRIEYRPSNLLGHIDLKIINPTSRYSLLLHQADEYKRIDYGNIPLSTIEQHIFITIKVR